MFFFPRVSKFQRKEAKYHSKIFVTMTFEVQIKLYCSFFLSMNIFNYEPHSCCNVRYCSCEPLTCFCRFSRKKGRTGWWNELLSRELYRELCLSGRHTFRTGECCLKEKGSDLLAKLWQLTTRNSIHSPPLSFYGVLRKRLGSVITTCKVIRLQLTR